MSSLKKNYKEKCITRTGFETKGNKAMKKKKWTVHEKLIPASTESIFKHG